MTHPFIAAAWAYLVTIVFFVKPGPRYLLIAELSLIGIIVTLAWVYYR